MTYTIHKFGLGHVHPHSRTILLPKFAPVVHIGLQDNEIVAWVWLDPDAPKVPRKFAVVFTGGDAPAYDEAIHLGTVQLAGASIGELVAHVFQEYVQP